MYGFDENRRIAERLREAAERLEKQGDNVFRVAAFRRAADTIEQWPRSLREIHDAHGPSGLQELPGVGSGIAAAICEMLVTGRWRRLERLRRAGPERVLTYFDDDGAEHECVVIDTHRRTKRWTPPSTPRST